MAEALLHDADPVEYPDWDGKPVETLQHYLAAHYVVGVFQMHFGADAHYGANNGLYYERGNPDAVLVPDVYCATHAPRHIAPSYKVWEEGGPPNFVLELASRSTVPRDVKEKRRIYAAMGVADYFLFDPVGGLLDPVLQGLRLAGRGYRRIRAARLADGGLSVPSEELGLELRAWGGARPPVLRLYDPTTGKVLLPLDEELRRATIAQRRATAAQRRAASAQRQAAEELRQERQANAELRRRLAELEGRTAGKQDR